MPPRFEGNPAELMEALAAVEARVPTVKPLKWIGPDFEGEYRAYSLWGSYRILPESSQGRWLTDVGGYWPSVEAAQAAAQADFNERILSAITSTTALEIRKKALEEAAQVAASLSYFVQYEYEPTGLKRAIKVDPEGRIAAAIRALQEKTQ